MARKVTVHYPRTSKKPLTTSSELVFAYGKMDDSFDPSKLVGTATLSPPPPKPKPISGSVVALSQPSPGQFWVMQFTLVKGTEYTFAFTYKGKPLFRRGEKPKIKRARSIPPLTIIVNNPQPNDTVGGDFIVSGNIDDQSGGTITVTLDPPAGTQTQLQAAPDWIVEIDDVPDGDYSLSVSWDDGMGNTEGPQSGGTFTVSTIPLPIGCSC